MTLSQVIHGHTLRNPESVNASDSSPRFSFLGLRWWWGFGDYHATSCTQINQVLVETQPAVAYLTNTVLKMLMKSQGWRLLPHSSHHSTRGQMEVQPRNDLPKVNHKTAALVLAPQAVLP